MAIIQDKLIKGKANVSTAAGNRIRTQNLTADVTPMNFNENKKISAGAFTNFNTTIGDGKW